MYASGPESGLALNFTGPRRMRHEQAAMSTCRLLHVVSLLVPSRVKAGGESLRNIEDRRPFSLCPPPRPPRALALRSYIIHRGQHQRTCGLVAECVLVVLDGREWRRLAQARHGRELLPERERRPPPEGAHRRQAHPGQAGRHHSGGGVPERRGARPIRVVLLLIVTGSVCGSCVSAYAGLTHSSTSENTRVIS
jgi:hypothetical protein